MDNPHSKSQRRTDNFSNIFSCELWPIITTYELGSDRVNMNHVAEYLG